MDSIDAIKLYAKAEELESMAKRMTERARMIRARADSICYNGVDIKFSADQQDACYEHTNRNCDKCEHTECKYK